MCNIDKTAAEVKTNFTLEQPHAPPPNPETQHHEPVIAPLGQQLSEGNHRATARHTQQFVAKRQQKLSETAFSSS